MDFRESAPSLVVGGFEEVGGPYEIKDIDQARSRKCCVEFIKDRGLHVTNLSLNQEYDSSV